jgi:hypothetical protein
VIETAVLQEYNNDVADPVQLRPVLLASAEVVEIRSDARHGVAVKAGVVIGSIG